MLVTCNVTNDVYDLRVVDPKTGVDCSQDYILNHSGDSILRVEDETGVHYTAPIEVINWWLDHLDARQQLDYWVHDLCYEYGTDAVYQVLDQVGGYDLDDEIIAQAEALSETFKQKD